MVLGANDANNFTILLYFCTNYSVMFFPAVIKILQI